MLLILALKEAEAGESVSSRPAWSIELSEFQDSLRCTEKPVLKNQKEEKKSCKWLLYVTHTQAFHWMVMLKVDPWRSILALGPPENLSEYTTRKKMMQSLNFEGPPVNSCGGNTSKSTLPVCPCGSFFAQH